MRSIAPDKSRTFLSFLVLAVSFAGASILVAVTPPLGSRPALAHDKTDIFEAVLAAVAEQQLHLTELHTEQYGRVVHAEVRVGQHGHCTVQLSRTESAALSGSGPWEAVVVCSEPVGSPAADSFPSTAWQQQQRPEDWQNARKPQDWQEPTPQPQQK